jgi:hypothetical protein
VKRRALVGLLFAVLCALALLGFVLQGLGLIEKTTERKAKP